MAINFEAANMAGYNNPRIEVFKAIMDFGTNVITDAPRKTEIIRCLRRGSIPALMMGSPDGSQEYLLWITTWATDVEGDTIMFNCSNLTIAYIPESDGPVVVTG